jgi:serine/threonine-protein kinase RsbW
MEANLRLNLPRDEASVPVVRGLCRRSFHTLGIEDDCAHDLELVVSEACTNVLKHAGGTGEQFGVEVTIDRSRCDVRVRDRGRGFDHAAVSTGEPTSLTAEGGRGLHLMRLLVDRIRFVSEPEGTVVHLTSR